MNRYSRLRFWFVPARCGDFRLERTGEESCRLTIIDPTAEDKARLDPFFVALRKKEGTWLDSALVDVGMFMGLCDPAKDKYLDAGETVVEFRRSVVEIGEMLAAATERPDRTSWTALRHEGGVLLFDGVQLVPKKVEPVAAVTLTAPQIGCPAPTPAARRASEVLRTFSTRRQWDQYRGEGRMRVYGNRTGRAYYVHHRDEAAARGLERCATEADTGRTICIWDADLPPEEETLAIKFALEHREDFATFAAVSHEDPAVRGMLSRGRRSILDRGNRNRMQK